MGSAGHTGVSASGFGRVEKSIRSAAAALARCPSILPAPFVIALVALLLGGTVAAYDALRTYGETSDRMALVASLAAAQLAPRDLDGTPTTPYGLPPILDIAPSLVLVGHEGKVIASTLAEIAPGAALDETALENRALTAAAVIEPGIGRVIVAIPRISVMAAVAKRAGLILAVALSALLLLGRTRRSRAAPARSATDLAFEAVPHGVAFWNGKGELLCANAAFARLLHLDAGLLRQGVPYASISKRIRGRISGRPVLDGTHQRMVEVEREDGTVVLLDERPSPHGGFVTLVSDVTDRKAADQMLSIIREEQRALARQYYEEKNRAQAASRAKTTFLAHLSHDLRTPLNHIIGFAEMMQLETFGPLGHARYRDYLCDIKRSGEKLLAAFADILEYAELEGGQREMRVEPIAIGDLLSCAAERFEPLAARAGVRLELGCGAAGLLSGDRGHFDRMLANLLDNAIRFTRRGGEIRLGAWTAEKGVVIEVTDTGTGMPAEQLTRLSEPFALPDHTCARDHDGIGLGIAIARAIAERSGGKLAIDSLEGVGTTVAIYLPMEARPIRPVETARAA